MTNIMRQDIFNRTVDEMETNMVIIARAYYDTCTHLVNAFNRSVTLSLRKQETIKASVALTQLCAVAPNSVKKGLSTSYLEERVRDAYKFNRMRPD